MTENDPRKGAPLGNVRLYMSMSVDGFITGPDDGPDRGLGRGGERLHAWLGDGAADPGSLRPAGGPNAQVFDEMMATGAVVTGRRTFDHGGQWGGDHHDGVPIFVLTRSVPDEPAPGHAQYVTDVASGVAQARAAAGGRRPGRHAARRGRRSGMSAGRAARRDRSCRA